MAKIKTVEDIQNSVLGNFTRTIRNHERSQRKGENLTQIERSMLTQKPSFNKDPKPRISFYNPNNPLNGFNGKSLEERQSILAMIKATKKK